MRDKFLTISYKGFYIQTCYDRDLKKEIVTVKGKQFKSLHVAKLYITNKAIPEHDKQMLAFVENNK